jgi:hypothetical protein
VIIGGYKADVLKKYLSSFANVDYDFVLADGDGSCGGLQQAQKFIPENEPLMVINSDLILSNNLKIPEISDNYIGISKTIKSDWNYKYNRLVKDHIEEFGVADLFIFKDKELLKNAPVIGDFIKYLSQSDIEFKPLDLLDTRKIETLQQYHKTEENISKDLNRIFFDDKEEVLKKITKLLNSIYKEREIPENIEDLKSEFCDKVIKAVEKIKDLVPFADRKIIKINGKDCKNVLFNLQEFRQMLGKIKSSEFTFFYGNCSFSNLVFWDNSEPVLINPIVTLGNLNCDLAKLYSSIACNYDSFCLRKFRLNILDYNIKFDIMPNGWQDFEDKFFELSGADIGLVKFLNAVMWLLMTDEVWQDYDSLCIAFYSGLYYLQDFWDNN